LSDAGFEGFFDGIGEFHSSVGEKLNAVVVKRIVRSGNDHAGFEIVLAHEAGDTGSGDDASEGNRSAALSQAGGEDGSDVRAGFAGVHADEDAGGTDFADEIGGERKAGRKESCVVKRRGAGDAADTVGAEKFFCHSGKPAKSSVKTAKGESNVSLAYARMAARKGNESCSRLET
jgi:hypothetical protein